MPARVAEYPWGLLERVPRSAVRAARGVRRRFEPAVRVALLGRSLSNTLSSEITLVVRSVSPAGEPPQADRSIHLATPDGAASVVVEPEPALAVALLSRLLGRPPAVTDVEGALAPALRGALAALAVEAARQTGGSVELRARSDAPEARCGLRVDATLLLDGRPYGVTAWAAECEVPSPLDVQEADPVALGDLPIDLRVVAAVSLATRPELESLGPGDVWMPGAGWLAGQTLPEGQSPRQALLSRAALATPSSEVGVEIGSEGGKLVLRNGSIALAAEVGAAWGDRTMSESNDTLKTLALDAPIVVRIEVGSVTLTAREWAALSPGDVVETGLRIAGPVVLRVAGQEVARGELVSVDGELGVRIRHLAGRNPAP